MDWVIIGRWALVIFFYIFTFLLCLIIVAYSAQYLKIAQRVSHRQMGLMVFALTLAIYLVFISYILNDWAVGMLRL